MRNYHQINDAELDRHITGNYGEDQFKGLVECPLCGGLYDPEMDETCYECGRVIPGYSVADEDD